MRLSTLTLSCAVAVLSACGGGGDPLTSNLNPTSSVTYQAVATEGELINYTVDTTALTYAYTIVESAYGKTGVSGSGQLTRNNDGSYTPNGFQGKVSVLASGLLLGAIYEDLDGDNDREIVPVIGIANPINSITEAAGIYNFVSRQCGTSCTNYYGTVQVHANGSWNTCVGANLASANPACQSPLNGTINAFSGGRATLQFGGRTAGSMLIFKDPTSSQKVVLMDLNGQTGLGKGAFFAASQSLPTSADGNWSYLHTNGTKGVANVSGNNFSDAGVNAYGNTYSEQGSFTRNQPWNGFIRTTNGATIMPAGSGLYAGYFGANNSMSVGVKQ